MTVEHTFKPCPFCGGKAKMWHEHEGTAHYVGCCSDDRRCLVEPCTAVFSDEDAAIAAWETRFMPQIEEGRE